MNRRGFTLIELIATIALLGIIATISFVSITNILKEGKVKNCNTLVNNIKMATSEYVSDNRYNSSFINAINDNQINIDASTLMAGRYLKGDIVNPFNNEVISASSIIIKVKLNNDYTFKSADIEAPEVLKNCTN